ARQLRQGRAQALRGGDVAQHAREQVLPQLEGADGLAELLALARVARRVLVRAAGAAHRLPRDAGAGHAQDLRRVAEAARLLQAVLLGDAAAVEGDERVLHHAQRHLVLDLLRGEPPRPLVHDEALDLIVAEVAGPDDDVVRERGVADPFLLAVEDPCVAVAARGRGQAARRARADLGLGQAERADAL